MPTPRKPDFRNVSTAFTRDWHTPSDRVAPAEKHTAPTLDAMEPVDVSLDELEPYFRVRASECVVLLLDAGEGRQAYVLVHAASASYLAAVDVGTDGTHAMLDFPMAWGDRDSALAALKTRVLPRVETTPSNYRRLLSPALQAKFAARRVQVSA